MNETSYFEKIFKIIQSIDFYQDIFKNPIFINIFSSAIFFIIGYFLVIFLSKKAKVKTIEQSYICINTSCIICEKKKYKIDDLPSFLMEYRRKLYSHEEDQNFMMWDTRISTFFAFTDGENILLFDRDKATKHVSFKNLINDISKKIKKMKVKEIITLLKKYQDSPKKMIINNGLDCYGAVAFHNPSLKYKLPEKFMSSHIEGIEPIPGIALEKNVKKFLKLPIFKTKSTAVMIGFIVSLSKEELLNGQDNRNTLFPINCLSSENNNLTSKAKLAIKHIKTPI